MTEKLSQFTVAGAAPALTDFVAGANAGSPNLKYTLTQIASTVAGTIPSASGFPIAGANLTYYVATTGSDTNNGTTIGTPFLTLQHALHVVSQFDYQGMFFPTINVAAGTYDFTAANLFFPPLFNCFNGNNGGLIVGANASTVIFKLVNRAIIANGTDSIWQFKTLTVDFGQSMATGAFQALNGGTINLTGTINQIDSSNTGNGTFFQVFNNGVINFTSCTLNISTNFATFINGDGFVNLNSGTINFEVTCGTNGWFIDCQQGSPIYYFDGGVTFTNKANYIGPQIIDSGSFAVIQTHNGLFSDLPGTTVIGAGSGGGVDNSVLLANRFSTAAFGYPFGTGPLAPNVGTYIIGKDSTNGPRMLTINDGGVSYTLQIGRNVNTQTSNYALQLFDQNGRVEMNAAGANTLTVPTNASVAFPIGTEIFVTQFGAGSTTIAGAGGVTVHNAGALSGQWASARLYKHGTDEWVQTT